jgi:uncharacterized C2H2 Zn-finger protein
VNWVHPLQPAAPIPHIRIKYGLHCRALLDSQSRQRCQAVFRDVKKMKKHCIEAHNWKDECTKGRLGRPRAKHSPLPREEEVPCQQLVWTGRGASFWRVYLELGDGFGNEHTIVGSDLNQNPTPLPVDKPTELCGTWDEVERRLDDHNQGRNNGDLAPTLGARYPIHFSPWIDKTGWAEYLAGLLELPNPNIEPGLAALLHAFDDLIATARESILSDKINVFGLHRVNSFLRGRPYSKPLHTKLLDGTYRKYRAVWHKLLYSSTA